MEQAGPSRSNTPQNGERLASKPGHFSIPGTGPTFPSSAPTRNETSSLRRINHHRLSLFHASKFASNEEEWFYVFRRRRYRAELESASP